MLIGVCTCDGKRRTSWLASVCPPKRLIENFCHSSQMLISMHEYRFVLLDIRYLVISNKVSYSMLKMLQLVHRLYIKLTSGSIFSVLCMPAAILPYLLVHYYSKLWWLDYVVYFSGSLLLFLVGSIVFSSLSYYVFYWLAAIIKCIGSILYALYYDARWYSVLYWLAPILNCIGSIILLYCPYSLLFCILVLAHRYSELRWLDSVLYFLLAWCFS
jgi:hypothetical protein